MGDRNGKGKHNCKGLDPNDMSRNNCFATEYDSDDSDRHSSSEFKNCLSIYSDKDDPNDCSSPVHTPNKKHVETCSGQRCPSYSENDDSDGCSSPVLTPKKKPDGSTSKTHQKERAPSYSRCPSGSSYVPESPEAQDWRAQEELETLKSQVADLKNKLEASDKELAAANLELLRVHLEKNLGCEAAKIDTIMNLLKNKHILCVEYLKKLDEGVRQRIFWGKLRNEVWNNLPDYVGECLFKVGEIAHVIMTVVQPQPEKIDGHDVTVLRVVEHPLVGIGVKILAPTCKAWIPLDELVKKSNGGGSGGGAGGAAGGGAGGGSGGGAGGAAGEGSGTKRKRP